MGYLGKGARKKHRFNKNNNTNEQQSVLTSTDDAKSILIEEIEDFVEECLPKRTGKYKRVPQDIAKRVVSRKVKCGYLRPGAARATGVWNNLNTSVNQGNIIVNLPKLIEMITSMTLTHGKCRPTCEANFKVLQKDIRGLGTALKLGCSRCRWKMDSLWKLYGKNSALTCFYRMH